MPDRRYTYTVEVDAQSAAQAAQQLKAVFQRELADILATPTSSAAPAQMLREVTQAAKETQQAVAQIGKIDAGASIEELTRRLEEARRLANLTRADFERMQIVSEDRTDDNTAGRKLHNARLKDYIENVERNVGADAANQVRLAGRAANIGQLNAEFASDQIDYAKLDAAIATAGDVQKKKRFSAEEKIALAQIEADLYAKELDVTQLERQIAERRSADLSRQADALLESGTELNEQNSRIFEQADEAAEQARILAQNEAELLNSVEAANKRLADAIAEDAQRTARAEAKRTGTIAAAGDIGAAAGPTAYTQQTALTVSSRSAEQAERLAAAMKEVAEASERSARALTNVNTRAFELETERERLKMQRDNASNTEKDLQEIRKAAAEERAEAEKTRAAQKRLESEAAAEKKRLEREKDREAKQAAREAADAQKKAAKEVREAEKQAAREYKLEQRQKAKEAKQAAKETADAQKKAAQAAKEAAKQAAAAQKEAGQFARDLFGRPFGMSWGSLIGGAAATAGIYGIDQLARGAYDSGRSGAQQLRQEDSFRQFAQAQGRDADALVKAIQRASKETITATDAMGLASQVLAQKFSAGRASITSDLETIVAFARRASQIYRDESGSFLSTEEVFARLIKYAREGNKELVDQFGLSNTVIAEALGTTVDGLASAAGAADRWKGLIMVLGDELVRLGDAGTSTADKIEQAESRITASKQRIDKALAEPTAQAAGLAADVVEAVTVGWGAFDLTAVAKNAAAMQQQIKAGYQSAGVGADQVTAIDEQIRRLEMYQMAVNQVREAQLQSVGGADDYSKSLVKIADSIKSTNQISDTELRTLIEINNWFQEAGKAADEAAKKQSAYGRALEITTKSGIRKNKAIADIVDTMQRYDRYLADGEISLATYEGAIRSLTRHLATMAAMAGYAVGQLNRMNSAAKKGADAVLPMWVVDGANNAGRRRDIVDDIGASRRNTRPSQNPVTGETLPETYGPDNKRPGDPWDQLGEKVTADQEKAAQEAQKEWERAAKSAAADFESAAEDAAGAFKSALEKIPGLFGTSEVTAEDMKAAELGIYQEKADEYLRQLRDEVLNNQDYAGVDLADIAKVAGIDQSLSRPAQLAQIESMWADSSLFANPEALRFINKDAVNASQERDKRSEEGRKNLLAYFGLEADSPLNPDQKGAFAKMIGLDDNSAKQAGTAARAAFDAGFYEPATGTTEGASDAAAGSGMAKTLVDQIQTDITAGPIADALYGLGSGIIAKLHAGFSAAASNQEWGAPVFDALAADVAPIVFQMLKDELPPPA